MIKTIVKLTMVFDISYFSSEHDTSVFTLPVTKALCRRSHFRNGHVTLSNLVVQTHQEAPGMPVVFLNV